MCLDHVGQLTRSNPRRIKRGGEHHIATDHGPMVQGGLLMVHPGSIHGGGEAPGGGSSLRQGAGKRAPGAPRSWKRCGGGTEERSQKRVLSSRVSGQEGYIGVGTQGMRM